MAIKGESKRNTLMAMARQEHSPVMLSEAKHLSAHRTRPFAEFTLSASEGLRACPEQSEWGDKQGPSPSTPCYLCSSAQTPSPLWNPGYVPEVYTYCPGGSCSLVHHFFPIK